MNKSLNIYQVDAFTNGAFTGNPAAVCPLDEWLPDKLMQQIAEENNLAETAFIVNEPNGYRIRWFTPTTEVRLCGHATLASGHVFFNILNYHEKKLSFNCLSGEISVTQSDDILTLDFPLDQLTEEDCPQIISQALNASPIACYKGESDYLLILSIESEVVSLNPDFGLLAKAPGRGCIVSARGEEYDVVSRGFFPQSGINEDPATGSAQTTLGAYWPKELGNDSFTNCQLSQRKGYFSNEVKGNRIAISGKTKLYLKGQIYL